MNYCGDILRAIRVLCEFFASRSAEPSTLAELARSAEGRALWRKAHGLFDRIRDKNLKAASQRETLLVAQYQFEEACAKTLYNLSKEAAPFDPDSPYWIVPTALNLAREAGISEQEIVQLVLANNVLQSTREDARA